MNIKSSAEFIKQQAIELGFDFCGIAKARKLDDDARRLEHWLTKDFHGKMDYMENHFDLRIDPTKLLPGAKSVITLLLNYHQSPQTDNDNPKIASYAKGKDYHLVIRDKLNIFLQTLRDTFGEINGRGFVDSAPVLERSWAQLAGLGWVGKNGNLITKQQGSFLFIATLIVDLPLAYDNPFTNDYCGTCTRCIDHCPTNAILPDKVIDGSKCISYFTIELKDALLPNSMQGKFDNWLFGCDTCQDVCPWNRFSKPHNEPAFQTIKALTNLSFSDWEEMSEATFKVLFKDSPLKRTKYNGIRRNLHFLQSSPDANID